MSPSERCMVTVLPSPPRTPKIKKKIFRLMRQKLFFMKGKHRSGLGLGTEVAHGCSGRQQDQQSIDPKP